MTFEQAMAKLETDRKAIEQAQSNLESVKALHTLGEDDKAINLYAATRKALRDAIKPEEE